MSARSARKLRADHGRAAAFAAVLLLAVGVVLPVQAQRLSLSQRVARLEQAQQQHNNGGQANQGTVLVNQVQALQSQVQQLQGQVEKLQHQLKLLQQTSKDQYVDLDSRIRRLEGGAPATASSAGAPVAAASAPSAKPVATVSSASGQAPADAGSTGKPAGPADPQAVQDAYNQAFNALRSGQFVQSAQQFRAFIAQHPDSALTPNAYYWLGESYYTVQNYDVALQAFQQLIKQYPDSEKTPGALLKAGYCQDALKQQDAAQKTLHTVVDKYPGSSVAKLAQQRLQDIALRQAN
jgi:tol-pal system protein YbgF